MQNILKDLYYGNFRPIEDNCPKNQAYTQKSLETKDLEIQLLSKLNEEEKELYEKLGHANYELWRIEDFYAFSNAFRLGAQLMLSCLTESGDSQ